MDKHILVVGGLRSMHKQLKKLGSRLSLMIEAPTIKMDDATIYDRIIGMSSKSLVSEWIDVATTLQRHDPIHAIGAYHEFDQDKAAAIAQKLGLPFHTIETITNIRQKDVMRERLRKAGVDPTASRRVKTVDDIIDFATIWNYPLILKPTDGWGSEGISVIYRESDIADALAWSTKGKPDSPLQIEQFLLGNEFSVEAFSEFGRHHILCVTQKFKEEKHCVELGHCLPITLSDTNMQTVSDVVQKTLMVLGVLNGPTHTEIIITQGGPHIIETHTRLGGDHIPDLYKLVTGIDLKEIWARQTIGESVLPHLYNPIQMNGFAAIWYITPQARGTLVKMEGEEDASTLPGISEVQTCLRLGQQLDSTRDSFSRVAYAIATGQSLDEAQKRAQTATEKLKFLISYPN